jgi:hypothetical protein
MLAALDKVSMATGLVSCAAHSHAFPGTAEEPVEQVEAFNESGQGRVVLLSFLPNVRPTRHG